MGKLEMVAICARTYCCFLKDGAVSSQSACILDSGVTERRVSELMEFNYGESSSRTRSAEGDAQSPILLVSGFCNIC